MVYIKTVKEQANETYTKFDLDHNSLGLCRADMALDRTPFLKSVFVQLSVVFEDYPLNIIIEN